MQKFKLFVENFLVYGLGGIISKIVPLIMVPVVTRLMPDTAYFGLSDLSSTIISFVSAFAIMGMYDAMFRMFFEKDDAQYKERVCSTALLFTMIMSLIIFVLMCIFRNAIANLFFGGTEYAYLIYITAIATLIGSTNSIISAPTRMQNKRKVFLVTNTLGPILSYAISIPLLLHGYYIIALPLAAVISSATIEFSFLILNHKWFSFQKFDPKVLKELIIIGVPLLPNFLIYWIFNSSDRLMITNLMATGVGAAGIYAVGSKLGHVSQLIYSAFAGGWQYFAFSTMGEDNQVKSNSLIFEYLGIISFCASLFMFAWCKLIFEILFTGEYVNGYIVSPYLFMAPLLQMLFQIAANQFIVIKRTWPNMLILSVGAGANVFLNLTLIPLMGIEGAAVATLVGYAISDTICVIVLCRMKLMIISKRFCIAVGITVIYILVWRFAAMTEILISTILAILVSTIFVLLYKTDLYKLIQGIREGKEKKKDDNAQ